MSKPKPGPPEMTDAQLNQSPPAEPRVDAKSPLDRVSDEMRHHRKGLVDPIPSVAKAFAAAPAPSDPDEENGGGSEYRGPWVVNNRFPMLGANGQRVSIDPTMPLPGGGRGRRILEVGDIPNELAQELWANGTISPKPLVAPQPRRARV